MGSFFIRYLVPRRRRAERTPGTGSTASAAKSGWSRSSSSALPASSACSVSIRGESNASITRGTHFDGTTSLHNSPACCRSPSLNSVVIGLPVTVGLGAVALIGYLFGNRTRTQQAAKSTSAANKSSIARPASPGSWKQSPTGLRQDLVTHHSQLATFKRNCAKPRKRHDKAWEQLCSEAEAMLGPTMQLAHQLSNAYDQIRQQSDALETFTQGRTDPLTGVGNGRALEQQLQILLNGAYRGNPAFSVALVSLDRGGGRRPLEGQSSAAAAETGERDSHLHAGQRFRRPLRRR